jgi:hypothetical protein
MIDIIVGGGTTFDDDDDIWYGDADDNQTPVPNDNNNATTVTDMIPMSDDVAAGHTSSFKQEYVQSIHTVIGKVNALIARSMWSGRAVTTHPPTSDSKIGELLQVLRSISPTIGEYLQIDSSNIRKHPELKKVLDNNT